MRWLAMTAAAALTAGPALADKTLITATPAERAAFVLPDDPALAGIAGPAARPSLVLVGYGAARLGEVAGPNGERWRVVVTPLR